MSEAIIGLKNRGFVLHPLNGKIPITQGWQNLTKTPDNIEKHYENGGNIGAVCGKASNITVIDMDSMLFAQELNGFELNTLKAMRTKGRGHIYFQYNPNLPPSKHHDLGIEILSDRNNIVVPPSIHPSGDVYQWIDEAAPLSKMPKEVEDKLLSLFKTESELKQFLGKTRHCFRNIIKRKPDMHGADGREYMIAVSTDLKAAGAGEEHIKMFAKLMYGDGFDSGRTLQEWRNIDASRTWTCEILRTKLGSYIELGECQQCEKRRQAYREELSTVRVIDPMNCLTDLGRAKQFVHEHYNDIRYCYPWKGWIYWTGQQWLKDNSGEVMRKGKATVEQLKLDIIKYAESIFDEKEREKVMKMANSNESKNKILSMIELAQSELNIPIMPEQLDLDKWMFNAQNGTIDLKTGRLNEQDRNQYITKLSIVPYDKDATCPLWLKFLDRIFAGNQEIINYVQKIAGQALTGDTSEEQLYIFWGTGANGKSTLLEALQYILSDYSLTIAVDVLLEKKVETVSNEIARLKGSRLVIASEPDFGKNLSEGKVKTLTGRDTINARFLFQESFQFKPEFKLIIATNHKPGIKGADHGMWRRLKMIPFTVTIPPEERDKTLDAKLRAEAPGILNWMIEGCLKWQQDGNIEPQSVTEATSEYQDEMDSLGDFFNFCTIKDSLRRTPHKILYTIYKFWAEYQETIPMSGKAFTQVLIERGFKKITSRDDNDKQYKGFEGISVTDLLLSVTLEYLQADDSEKELKRKKLLLMLSDFDNLSTNKKNIVVVNSENNSNINNNGNPLTIITSLQSVTSVTTVTTVIISKLKGRYDHFNKPESIKDLERLQKNMRLFILTEIDEKIDDKHLDKIINEYCQSRGWN